MKENLKRVAGAGRLTHVFAKRKEMFDNDDDYDGDDMRDPHDTGKYDVVVNLLLEEED
jgi:hypothetical protein